MATRPLTPAQAGKLGGFARSRTLRAATRERDEKIFADGRTLREIAADYGLTYQAVWKIKERMKASAAA